MSLTELIKLGRPGFLIYSMLAYDMGVLLSIYGTNNSLNIYNFFYGQLIVCLIHLQTHYYNEYYDCEIDFFNRFVSPWTGGSHILTKQNINKKISLWIGITLSLITLLLNHHLSSINNLIVKMAIIWSVLYSELNKICLGEMTVALVLNVYTPLFGYFMQLESNKFPNVSLLSIILVHSLIEWSRMTIMNLPDRISDIYAKKYTTSVTLGPAVISNLHFSTLLMSCFLSYFLYFFNLITHEFLLVVLLTTPLGMWISIRLNIHKDWKSVETMYSIPFWSSVHNALLLCGTVISLLTYMYSNNTYTYLECLICSFAPLLFLSNLSYILINGYFKTGIFQPVVILHNTKSTNNLSCWNVLLSYHGPTINIQKSIRHYYSADNKDTTWTTTSVHKNRENNCNS